MIQDVEKLYAIATKKERLIIGLMSGTSLDGLDIALCRFSGSGTDTITDLEKFETVAYSDDFRNEVKAIFSKKSVDLEKVCLLNAWIALQHASIINGCLKKWHVNPQEVDAIASHGQSIYHAPRSHHAIQKFPNATLQIGDGDHIAVKTGIITLSDFRQKHVAAGGEGAPLAVYGDYLIFSKKGEDRVLLNIGGIANFTYLPGDLSLSNVFCSDVGPGNTMMDSFVQKQFPGRHHDHNAELALRGTVNSKLLANLKAHAFFGYDFPKTTGPELFNLSYLENAINAGVRPLPPEDILATLNQFSADMIVDALKKTVSEKSTRVYLSGGGMHNPLLRKNIEKQLPNLAFTTTDELGIHPDAKEAVLFAVLANETLSGHGLGNSQRTDLPNISMGKISFPH